MDESHMKLEIEISGDTEARLREDARASGIEAEMIATSLLQDALGDTQCAICGDPRRSRSDGVGTGFGLAHHYCYDPDLKRRRVWATIGTLTLIGWVCATNRSPGSLELVRWVLSVAIMAGGYVAGGSKADLYRSFVDVRWNDFRYGGFYDIFIVAFLFGTVLYLGGSFTWWLVAPWLRRLTTG